MTFKYLLLWAFCLFTFTSCSKDKKEVRTPVIPVEPEPIIYNDAEVNDSLRINQLQYLSSHNSYRKHTDTTIFTVLNNLLALLPSPNKLPISLIDLDYDHIKLYTQLNQYGVRHVELDIYGDKDGGRFYNRGGYEWTNRNPASGIEELKQPGLKVLHIPDIDFETNNYTFISALQELKKWSDDHPDHLPLFVLIETKTETIAQYVPLKGFVTAEPWDQEHLTEIDKEILEVFPKEQIIKPDDIRKNHTTLREGVLTEGWPTVGESRGKIMFMFDQQDITPTYKQGNNSLEGKIVFTNANPNDPDAAFIKRNDPKENDVQSLVQKGFLVRSMIGGVDQNRANDYSLFEMAKAKGVHFLSTDYYRPDPRAGKDGWTDFTIKLKHHSYRINPVTASH